MKFYKNKTIFTMAVIGILLAACSKDDDDTTPVIPNEEELITTVIMTLSPLDGSAPTIFKYTDLDGDGDDPPTIEVDSLPAGTDFVATLELLNEASVPAEDITEEITEEDDEHQFFFQTDGSINLSVTYADQDGKGNPIGLSNSLSTGTTGSGNLTIILRHQPDKSAAGVAEGDIQNAGGETDIEVEFPIYVYP